MTTIFLWDNFGPFHWDRLNSATAELAESDSVLGVQIFARSDEYAWMETRSGKAEVCTLFEERTQFSKLRFLKKFVGMVHARNAKTVFICNHDRSYIFIAAIVLRLIGRTVYLMSDSKFDDRTRYLWKEVLKSFFLLPYSGALTASLRSQDYFRFLGLRPDRIKLSYDALSVDRLRRQCEDVVPPAFEARPLIVVARMVPKKNIQMALSAFAMAFGERRERRMTVCGSGEMEQELRALTQELSIEDLVTFTGFVQSEEISHLVVSSLVLILPSYEEQFGLVIAEAQALAIPVIASTVCGSRDELVRNEVNGLLIEPNNVEGLALMMKRLSRDEALWLRMSKATARFAELADSVNFARSVRSLMDAK